ncbi:hypothetical protein MSG28_013640 [Choristoneura fumiferana]|uniref:Uncharacterized protein n=1 Tax=Choristoneura fumiferana TaxID=7141 RepID=A0ACC0K851_CHOFU|nr:hypothetical protein MSG28_013640 [Choristoneura fumiferana]
MGGSLTVLVFSVFAVILLISYTDASSCPLPTKVYGCSPKCTQNYDCKGGKLCCRNGCNAMSCAEPVSNGQGTSGDKYSAGSGVYCNNQKCSPQEVCKQDPATKRMKCVRA